MMRVMTSRSEMPAQRDLFTWGAPPAPPAPRRPADGFRIWHPCECGRTHTMVWLTAPYGMIGLRHWSISEPQDGTRKMMDERLHDWGLMQ